MYPGDYGSGIDIARFNVTKNSRIYDLGVEHMVDTDVLHSMSYVKSFAPSIARVKVSDDGNSIDSMSTIRRATEAPPPSSCQRFPCDDSHPSPPRASSPSAYGDLLRRHTQHSMQSSGVPLMSGPLIVRPRLMTSLPSQVLPCFHTKWLPALEWNGWVCSGHGRDKTIYVDMITFEPTYLANS